MLESAVRLAFADLKHILRRREIWLWTLGRPGVFFYFIGMISRNAGGGGDRDLVVLVSPGNAGFLADHFAVHMEKTGYKVLRATAEEAANRDRVLILPEDFTATLLAHKPVKLDFHHTDTGQSDDNDRVRLQKALYTLIGDLAVTPHPDAESLAKLDATPRSVELRIQPAGKRKQIPFAFDQSVPGTMVFFLLLVLLTSGAAMLLVEREAGILRRLASAPISRTGVVLAKWMSRMFLGALQIAFCIIAGTLIFHMHWGDHLPVIFLVLFAYASMAAAAGLALGSLARTRPQVAAFGSIASNVLACIGGCWWPAEIMPPNVQAISRWTPPGIAMDALHQLVNFGAGPGVVVPHMIAMTAYALVAGYFAARSFRFQ